jgi:hypothetical protein
MKKTGSDFVDIQHARVKQDFTQRIWSNTPKQKVN